MNDAELRALFPTHIARGALLRPDGVAVGLVIGGAPAWDLLSVVGRNQAGEEYHRLLMALDAPLDVYVVEQPPDLTREIEELQSRRARASHPTPAETLEDIADYLVELGQSTGSRAKQVVWAIRVGAPSGPPTRSAGGLDLTGLLRAGRPARSNGPSAAGRAALSQALERARRLADAVRALQGTPPPRVMEAEEIARLLYQLADPVRATRYPLAGALLDRVRRVITTPGRETSSQAVGQGVSRTESMKEDHGTA